MRFNNVLFVHVSVTAKRSETEINFEMVSFPLQEFLQVMSIFYQTHVHMGSDHWGRNVCLYEKFCC